MADAALTSPITVTAPEPAGISEFPVEPGPSTVKAPILESSSNEKKLETTNTPTAPAAPTAAATSEPILLRSPLKSSSSKATDFQPPPLEWLERTWTVTHSTLPMWRKAKNVRISYKILPAKTASGPRLLDDTVESVPTEKTWMPQPKSIRGIDTPDGEGGWNWRGKGLLKLVTSHWEVLGWGERKETGERWVVTWFEASLFTPAGLDVYCDRREGMSEGLYGDIVMALEGLESVECSALVKAHMLPVVIDD